MKSNKLDLHMDRRRALFLMLFFGLALFLVNVFAVLSVNRECAHLNSLLRSRYDYSATASRVTKQDDYYVFNAGIDFTVAPNAKTALNVDILMQSDQSEYSSSVDWNSSRLSTFGVAVTKGVAKANNLKVGDKLYSNHIVDGTVHEYVVEQVLPEVSSARITEKRNYNEGVIVIGFDETYLENLTHFVLLYTSRSIDEFPAIISETPINIRYRSDEIVAVVGMIIPYAVAFFIIGVLLTAAFVFNLTRAVGNNYKRLMILGYEEKKLNYSYMAVIYGTVIPVIIIAFIVAIIISTAVISSSVMLILLVMILLSELMTLTVSALLSRRQLWR